MGYIRHHTIAITSWKKEELEKLHIKINAIAPNIITNIYKSPLNGYHTFYLIPDGSKEGWEESEAYNEIRNRIKNIIKEMKYDDGSNCIRFCELYYGGDDSKPKIEGFN